MESWCRGDRVRVHVPAAGGDVDNTSVGITGGSSVVAVVRGRRGVFLGGLASASVALDGVVLLLLLLALVPHEDRHGRGREAGLTVELEPPPFLQGHERVHVLLGRRSGWGEREGGELALSFLACKPRDGLLGCKLTASGDTTAEQG